MDAFGGGHPWLNATAGALAGTLVMSSLFPVDAVKTFMQANGTSATEACRILAHNQPNAAALLRRVFRGITPALVEHAINRSLLFGMGSYFKSAMPDTLPEPARDALSGGGAAMIKTVALHPIDTMKTRWQLGQERFNFFGMYRGVTPATIRSSFGMAIWLTTRNALERSLEPGQGESPRWWRHLASGALSSVMTDALTFPLDTLKKNMQAAKSRREMTASTHMTTTAMSLVSEGGVFRLYRGYTPRLLMVSVNGALFNTAFVTFQKLLVPFVECGEQ